MDSRSLGVNDNNSDLNARERLLWRDNWKVYTRKNFRKKAQLETLNKDSATTSTTAAEPTPAVSTTGNAEPTSSSPAKHEFGRKNATLEPYLAETLAAQNGSTSQEQPQSRSEGEPSTSDVVRPPEEATGGQEAVPIGGEDHPLNGGQEDKEVLPDVQKSVPNGGREESTPSSGHKALPEMQPTGGQEEEPTRSDGPEAEQEALPCTREDPPEREQSEVAVTLPNPEGPGVTGGDPVNVAASAVLVNGFSKPINTRVEDRATINITGPRSKDEMRKLKRKLESQLDHVRSLVEKVEAKVHQVTADNTSNVNTNSSYVGGIAGNFGGFNHPQLVRTNSEVGTVGHPYSRPQLMRVNSEVGSVGYQETRPFRHLSVSVIENNHGAGEFVEKEKRTPRANQYYRNSEFLLGKDRLPPESNKKLKLSAKKHVGDSAYGYGFGFGKNRDKVFRSCSNLLQRLMKHKHSWVFNEPVDANKFNIPDYHIIIKHPMDFGTIKTRLAQNWYKSHREFAEDVRLVFRNAMTYNPKGQDVHTMAEELSKIFEERWIVIEKEFFPYQMYYDAGLPIPGQRKAPPAPSPTFAPVPAPILAPVTIPLTPPMRTLDRSESMTMPIDSRLKPSYSNLPHVGRKPVPKKPKAKDPNKRDMTYEEKQKLSTNLQSLPSEKLDALVQIIKKRTLSLSQHDDEIEVDIDSVDAETLWELDRFVTNYKKSLSKHKRKAELALQRRAEAAQAVPTTNPTPVVVEAQKESRTGEKNSPPVVEVEKQVDNVSGSSSSSSSSSDSGSSSSDSDSDSSSAYGSDAGHSPKT